MSIQQTLIIVKPDGLLKGLIGQILYCLKKQGLIVIDSNRTKLSCKLIKELYKGEEKEIYFQEVVDWVSSDQVLLLKIRGPEAIQKVKWHIIGRYPNGIRGQYSENWIKNVAHAPDSQKAAMRELKLVKQIFERKRQMNEKLFNKKMIFALTGMSESGKSTVGKYLESHGVPRLKIAKLFECVRDKWSPEENLYEFIKKEEGRDPYALWDTFIQKLLDEMKKRKTNMVSIESLYGGGLGPYLKQQMRNHFCIVYIDIPLRIRLQRQLQRKNLSAIKEAKEILLPRDKVKTDSGIPQLKKIAEEIIDNSGTLEDLYKAVNNMIIRHKKNS